ncbi:MAG: 50S ribosomal protein L9 [Alphaproteobacteria bacterium]|nr:50S ribosomal protein L9 [Alphaproteobacteria bacterium]HCQ71379.1 50S ribosomal protein L9 [Rhodospirillaceae bacterium]|tara:strand:- start:117 stop:860 length:744 start_codon:yes stop_codon:yes gene_type:complete
MSTQVILLERVEKLGNMGEIVSVKPGFARNYLLPQKKALRASKANIAYFETQKKQLEADNAARRKDAEKEAKALENLTVTMIRQASESGQLYGSVTARDIADVVGETAKTTIARTAIQLNQNFKETGLFPIEVMLHPEVKVEVTINIARNEEEAKIQLETGVSASTAGAMQEAEEVDTEAQLSAALTEDALKAEQEKAAAEAEEAAEAEKKAAEKAAKKAEKAAAKQADEEEAEVSEEASEETAEEA